MFRMAGAPAAVRAVWGQQTHKWFPQVCQKAVQRCCSRRPISTSSKTYNEDKVPQETTSKDAVKSAESQAKIEDVKPQAHAVYRKQKYANPIERTFGILGDDIRKLFGAPIATAEPSGERADSSKQYQKSDRLELWPHFCDVLIVGGGAMGSSIAYHLKEQALGGLNVVVVEEDSSYNKASTVLSVGGIRQQFSVEENIQLSQYGAEFLRKSRHLLAVEGHDTPSMQFNPHGYLTLASPAGTQQLMQNYDMQIKMGAKMEMMSAEQLGERFAWLNTAGVEAGVLGLENEGWFDPWSFLLALKRKAINLGTQYVTGKVTGFECETNDDMIVEGVAKSKISSIKSASVTLPNGEVQEINCSILIMAAGAWTGELGRLVGIGEGEGIMAQPIPVEPRKRYVYCFHTPNGPGLDCPLVIDPNGTYFRREGLGGLYLCGQSPADHQEPEHNNLDVDHQFFETNVWPTIAHRVPAFEKLKMRSAWAGYYDYNTYDQNGIVGLHPLFSNMFITTGFSGHGIQQAAGVGRAIMECIIHGEYRTINLSRFGFDRFLFDEPLYEANIV